MFVLQARSDRLLGGGQGGGVRRQEQLPHREHVLDLPARHQPVAGDGVPQQGEALQQRRGGQREPGRAGWEGRERGH